MSSTEDSEYIPALRFHGLTPFYDSIVALVSRERRVKTALIEQADILPGHRVLDVACGSGTLAVWLLQEVPGAIVAGVDSDRAILEQARAKAGRAGVSLRLDRALAHELPYPDACFDRVVSSFFFHHLTWYRKVLTAREMFRVLKPGGSLHIADWGKATNGLMRTLFFFVQLFDGFDATRDNAAGRLGELFERVGFAQVRLHRTWSTVVGTMEMHEAVKPG